METSVHYIAADVVIIVLLPFSFKAFGLTTATVFCVGKKNSNSLLASTSLSAP